jgi:hypothetical protein
MAFWSNKGPSTEEQLQAAKAQLESIATLLSAEKGTDLATLVRELKEAKDRHSNSREIMKLLEEDGRKAIDQLNKDKLILQGQLRASEDQLRIANEEKARLTRELEAIHNARIKTEKVIKELIATQESIIQLINAARLRVAHIIDEVRKVTDSSIYFREDDANTGSPNWKELQEERSRIFFPAAGMSFSQTQLAAMKAKGLPADRAPMETLQNALKALHSILKNLEQYTLLVKERKQAMEHVKEIQAYMADFEIKYIDIIKRKSIYSEFTVIDIDKKIVAAIESESLEETHIEQVNHKIFAIVNTLVSQVRIAHENLSNPYNGVFFKDWDAQIYPPIAAHFTDLVTAVVTHVDENEALSNRLFTEQEEILLGFEKQFNVTLIRHRQAALQRTIKQ